MLWLSMSLIILSAGASLVWTGPQNSWTEPPFNVITEWYWVIQGPVPLLLPHLSSWGHRRQRRRTRYLIRRIFPPYSSIQMRHWNRRSYPRLKKFNHGVENRGDGMKYHGRRITICCFIRTTKYCCNISTRHSCDCTYSCARRCRSMYWVHQQGGQVLLLLVQRNQLLMLCNWLLSTYLPILQVVVPEEQRQ